MITDEQARAAAAYIQSGGEPDDHERLSKIAWDKLAEWAIQELAGRKPDASAVSAAERMEQRQAGLSVDVNPADDIATLTRWAMERLRRWDAGERPSKIYPDLPDPIEAANNDAWDLARRCIAAHRTQPDDGPITAEWLKSLGFRPPLSADFEGLWIDNVLGYDIRWQKVRVHSAYLEIATRWQLLALLAALRGEPSGQTGQLLEPLSPAEQLPHVSRGPLNNI